MTPSCPKGKGEIMFKANITEISDGTRTGAVQNLINNEAWLGLKRKKPRDMIKPKIMTVSADVELCTKEFKKYFWNPLKSNSLKLKKE